ncbi:MAG: Two component transcriptional regulator, winged helix family [candidate division WWE3 bacterium GW2011_GWF2_41_45]|uniref:DNA-binding response regulator n=3 Tax=Katanobacteria TaxID=422282 RepID=A0A1F4W476_UNCKA|nr:MAG: Two component transcriptional regulator, winged helix family [candidate division WWE3 bacterium GW2011_GWC2_41_23]KKS10658.1 MAG: Two component transcriptional regulator, winged helix family [candidate division WWE3 bacterium GW2011_GWF2_41_45]KKS12331.1 MAG: Two component transcriptional regulator, winged helix family [candidate division WWE3 bacterium GW2011_GWF1_41_53]KKS20405.1 MAG: Two component transcriptional regulator, winged helix family [candidate division WWE3 bacterium GW2011
MRLLVVEDEHKIANSIKKGLEQETYSVDVSYDGSDGYDLASTEEYDAIVLDLMLPGMNGLEICQKLREQKIHTPILMLTAKSELEDKISGLNNGADDYLTKPFAFEELLARIRALLRRPSATLQTILKFQDLTLDTTNFDVIRNKTKIVLSKKEFSLLEYLMRNPGKVLTKENLANHVWDYDSDILPNTIEQYVGYLRNKIDKPFPNKKPLINTVRGFGYKLGTDN